jgi:hypothetical protein
MRPVDATRSDRFATVVRRAVESLLGLTLRDWLVISICLVVVCATLVQQYLAYSAALPYHKEAHKAMASFDKECQIIKKNHNTAYLKMELDCIKANVTAQFTPEWNTIQMLVNTSWPHADNLVEWTTNAFVKIISSFQSMCLFIALVIAFWPTVKKRFGFVSDKINRAKGNKVGTELQKLVAAHTLTAALAALNKPLVIAPAATPPVVPEEKEEEEEEDQTITLRG